MALTQGARNKIKSIVQSAKKLLMKEFESQLQQYYGIRPDGTCLLVEELTSREASVIETARLLRQRLHYLEEGIAGSNKAPEAVRQLIREQAFTILNRFAAVRMSEERNIIRESIRKGYNSEGFLVYDQLTGGAKTAEQFTRYTWYIGHVFDELAIDLPAVFDRFSPYALLFPSEKVLLELLEIINDEDLNIYRESGHQPINLWTEDETIGWIYQYYNSREEISEMREASGAPRNSRELAVRNQFFTPRYIVQFLVDNSLGRQWFEMTKGQTSLIDSCQYLVKREQEIFLEKGEEIPEAKIEVANYIEYRALKDPREILMLDPACGSMHFGLYCFDLFEQIYLEAWDNHPELMTDLRDKYMRDDFIKRIPGYILRHNIHGVDIDPRAIQIAGLSLWLRAQKSYDKLGLQPADRPAISKSNLVIAEPMPGDANLLSEFTKSLPGPIGKLVRVIWDKMQLAGETGLLLKIEEELKKEIEIAKEEYKEYKGGSTQASLFGGTEDLKAAEMAAIYGKGQKITKDFFDTAEEEVLKALKGFAENAEGEVAFQKLLFAEDTARGFAFIELCRKRYDVIVMNPPFGAASIRTEGYLKEAFPFWAKNLINAFITRMKKKLDSAGLLGFIIDNSVSLRSTYSSTREKYINGYISTLAETGWGVLDANVETTTLVIRNNRVRDGVFFNVSESSYKDLELLNRLKLLSSSNLESAVILDSSTFNLLPNKILGHTIENSIFNFFLNNKSAINYGFQARKGHNLKSEVFNRMYWEVNDYSCTKPLYNGGQYTQFYYPYRRITKWYEPEYKLKNSRSVVLRNTQNQEIRGIAYGKRGDYIDLHVLKDGFIFTNEGQAINDIDRKLIAHGLLYFNSILPQYLVNLYTGQQKEAGYVNLIPVKANHNSTEFLESKLLQIIALKAKWFKIDETTMEFESLVLNLDNSMGIKESIDKFLAEYDLDSARYQGFVDENDSYWLNESDLPEEVQAAIYESRNKRTSDPLTSLKLETNREKEIFQAIIQEIVGICFGRWSTNLSERNLSDVTQFSEVFNPIEFFKLSHVLKKNDLGHVEKSWLEPEELMTLMRQFVGDYWSEDDLDNLMENLFGLGSLQLYLTEPNGFFDAHYDCYTKNRREAPIYWPIATKSNKYIIWVYYPAINENTLYTVVNELVDPKIKEIAKEVVVLELKGIAKELNDQIEFLAELEDFKEELLRVAQLPYKPNQDDGVLITAAPLHNLFRHSKWKKSTQDCWKKLEKGEYDWAHLAYSIWPDRVRKKCVQDLSMAIAHGLEKICEIKPKETKKKKPKEIKAEAQKRLM